ncbi:MAG: hypothetical protein INR69_02585 [Mucilaginibacter polytrichastri]|nr:hypothetical protein [Mucilaginibacter polytrichastri]
MSLFHPCFLRVAPPDGGMLYTETNMERLFPEPLNMLTSCFFLALAVYWTFRLRGNFRSYAFLSICLALLYIGGIGGTIYHGLRQWNFFIMMDWLPIMLLCLMAGVYFLARITRWYFAALILIVYFIFQILVRRMLAGRDMQLFINVNYGVMGLIVLLPVLLYLYKTNWKHGRYVGFALASFVPALIFRISDGSGLLPVGTHFLWHTFGAMAAFFMFRFIYETSRPEALQSGNQP